MMQRAAGGGTAPAENRARSPFDGLAVTEDSLVETMARLRDAGFTGDFVPEHDAIPPAVRCQACGRRHLPNRLQFMGAHRFEGPTSPEDEAILLALACPRCGARGLLATAYGPAATSEEAELLVGVARSARESATPSSARTSRPQP